MKLSLLTSLLLSLLSLGSHAADYDRQIQINLLDSIIDATPVTPIEGAWQFLPDNAAIAIIRQPGSLSHSGPTRFDIYLYSTVSSRISSGTLIGTLSATAESGTYLAEMSANPAGASGKNKKFTVRLTDPSHLSFSAIKSGLSINLWRLLPYLFRVSVSRNSNHDGNPGCVKIKPLVPGVSEPVRYL